VVWGGGGKVTVTVTDGNTDPSIQQLVDLQVGVEL
jgi:hypothetical protein